MLSGRHHPQLIYTQTHIQPHTHIYRASRPPSSPSLSRTGCTAQLISAEGLANRASWQGLHRQSGGGVWTGEWWGGGVEWGVGGSCLVLHTHRCVRKCTLVLLFNSTDVCAHPAPASDKRKDWGNAQKLQPKRARLLLWRRRTVLINICKCADSGCGGVDGAGRGAPREGNPHKENKA